MANGRQRTSGIFSSIVLITVGVLFLLHNYSGFRIGYILTHYWPLILIFWGVVKLFERTLAQREGRPGGWITPGEVFLVIGLLALAGIFISYDYVKNRIPPNLIEIGNPFTYDVDVAPKAVPPNAPVDISTGRGDISVRSSDVSEIRVSGKKTIRTWDERDANKLAAPVAIEIAQDGGAYEVRPAGFDINDTRFSLDMDAVVPKKSSLTVHSDRGDLTVSDMAAGVAVIGRHGDIEISDTTGGVSVDTRRGDVKVTDTKGDVKISNSSNEVGGEISVINATGSLSINGEFFGPIRAEKIAKGVRFLSQHTDLTLNQLTGHMEVGPGNLEIADAPGNISVRTRSKDISIENPTAKVSVENRDASVDIRFSSPPKDDVQITNSSAGITLSIPGSSSFEIQADCHSCDILSDFSSDSLKKTTNASGDSHLEGKYGSARGPRIILKTSYGSIILRKTT
jgi:LiaF transmembrane domain